MKYMKYLRFALLFILLALLFRQLRNDIPDLVILRSLLSQLKLGYLVLGFIGLLGSYLADGLLSQTLLKITGKKLKLKETLSVAIINVFASQLLPLGQAGTTLTTFYLYKILDVPNNNIVFLIFSWPAITVGALVVLFLVSWFLLPVHPAFGLQLHIWPVFIALAAMIILAIPELRKKIFYKLLKILKKWVGDFSLKTSLSENLKNITERKLSFAFCIFLGFLYYFSQAMVLYSSLLAFGVDAGITELFFIQTITLALSMFSLVPGGLGVTESSLTLGLVFFGFQSPRVLGGVILFRVITFWIPLIIGFIVYWRFTKNKQLPPIVQRGPERKTSDLPEN